MMPPIREWIDEDHAASSIFRQGGLLRVFQDEIPQNIPQPKDGPPACIFRLISGLPERYLGDAPGIDQFRVQIDVYARESAVAEAAARAIRNALQSKGYVSFTITERDSDTRNYRWSMDLSVWLNR